MRIKLALLSFGVCGASALAQPYEIASFTLDAGGGVSTGGSFELHGTIGQPDAGGLLSGSAYALTGGFWGSAGTGPCNAADLALPLGTLDFSDVLAFLTAFGVMDPAADLAAPTGTFDFTDVIAFLSAFGAGCP